MADNKENTGAIFKNKNKTATNHPDYRGTVNANGQEMEIALWLRESKSGLKYFSVMLSEPFVKHDRPDQPPPDQEDQNSDLPF